MRGFQSYDPGRAVRPSTRSANSFRPYEPGHLGEPPLPEKQYPSEAERNLLPLKVEQYNDTTGGIVLNEEGKRFLEAVRRGFVPNTPIGLGTLEAWGGVGREERIRAGLYDFDAFLSKWYGGSYADAVSAAHQAAPLWGADLNAWLRAIDGQYGQTSGSDLVKNEVTGQWVPKSDVLFYGTLSDGQVELRTAAGTWRWPGPGYVEPVVRRWTGKVAIENVLDDSEAQGQAASGPLYPAIAMKQDEFQTDGTWERFPWIGLSKITNGPEEQRFHRETIEKYGSTVRTRLWSTLSAAEKAEIERDLGGTVSIVKIPRASAPTPVQTVTRNTDLTIPSPETIPVGVPPVVRNDGSLAPAPPMTSSGGMRPPLTFGSDDVTRVTLSVAGQQPSDALPLVKIIGYAAAAGLGLALLAGAFGRSRRR